MLTQSNPYLATRLGYPSSDSLPISTFHITPFAVVNLLVRPLVQYFSNLRALREETKNISTSVPDFPETRSLYLILNNGRFCKRTGPVPPIPKPLRPLFLQGMYPYAARRKASTFSMYRVCSRS